MIYIVLVAFILLISPLFYDLKGNSRLLLFCGKKISGGMLYLILIAFCFILIATLRHYSIGIDTETYKSAFERDMHGDLSFLIKRSPFEPGLVFLHYIIRVFGGFWLLQLVVSSFYLFSVFRLIHKFSLAPWLSCILFLFLGFYSLELNELRQSIAIGFTCLAFVPLINRNIFLFSFWIFVAFLFHQTAAIFFPLYFLYTKKMNYIYIILYLLLLFLSFAIAELVFSTLSEFSRTILPEQETGGELMFAFQLLTLIIAFILKKNILYNNRANCGFFVAIICTVILFPICNSNPAFFRLQQYSFIFMIIFIPNILFSISNKFIRYIGLFSYLAVVSYFAYTNVLTEDRQLIPYRFFWQ